MADWLRRASPRLLVRLGAIAGPPIIVLDVSLLSREHSVLVGLNSCKPPLGCPGRKDSGALSVSRVSPSSLRNMFLMQHYSRAAKLLKIGASLFFTANSPSNKRHRFRESRAVRGAKLVLQLFHELMDAG